MQPFNKRFYEKQSGGSKQSAQLIIPHILELIKAKSVIDVGCGIGTWLSVFWDCGVKDILGVDGSYVDSNMLQIPKEKFLIADLREPLNIEKKFDLVMSVEVAEHLPEEKSEDFVKSLIRLGPVILFSAAVPFQGGDQHINEQWPDFWVQNFKRQGYLAVDAIRNKIWQNDNIEYWYRQNMLLFVKEEYLNSNVELMNEYNKTNLDMLSVVHPKLYTIHCSGLTKPIQIVTIFKNTLNHKLKNIFHANEAH